jgi:replicative DNA helicase
MGISFESGRFIEAHTQAAKLSPKIVRFNVDYLDDATIGLYPTDVILISAATGAGKTHIASLLSERWAKAGKRVAFFALEARRREIEQRILYREMYAGGGLPGAFANYIQRAHKDDWSRLAIEAAQRIEQSWGTRLGTSYSGGKFGPDDIVREFAQLRGKADVIVLDHLHFLTLGENENKDMKEALATISSMANDLEIPIVCVAHIRKLGRTKALIPSLEEIHGSSDISKIATTAIMLSPAQDVASESHIAPTFMQVVKLRIGGVTPFAACVHFDTRTEDYEPGYTLVRLSGNREEYEKIGRADKPYWARRAR